ncbi:hypothetical protein DID88_004834 [Monilinia fructigena]|uniref:YDG domain-containing protein n=1 Tax=Monilinia fructigena TaxID=38457 RepID=A0A395IPQ5_9HELO|nr:hypothetical protein DID88_004834 [Monilinia fructigena]
MDSQIIGSPFPKSYNGERQIETLVYVRNSKVKSITICRHCKAFHMSYEECGEIPIKMNEIISDYPEPLLLKLPPIDPLPPLPSLGVLSPIPIYLNDIPDNNANGLMTVTQSMGLDGSDGTAGRDGRNFALSRLATSGNKPALVTPLSPLHQFVTSPFNSMPLSPAFSDSSGPSVLFGIWKISELSKPPPEDGDDYRLDKSDFIRQQLRKPVFPLHEIQTLESLIDDLIGEGSSLEFEVVAQARLDKIVEEILQHHKKLREQWIETFGERYHTMDEERLKFMKEAGCLRDLELQKTGEVSKRDGPMWTIKKAKTFSEKEANENFSPGAWFLNTHCAVRDGIVPDAKDGFTWGVNGKPVAFSMLSGFEIKGIGRRHWVHIIESRVYAYHAVRLTCVGSVIRLLRGHKLKSERAPRLGVRYDGLYKIESWGQVLLKLSAGPDIYRNTLTIVELPRQNTIEELAIIPTPWQMDNFMIYNRMIESYIKTNEGEASYKEYRASEAKKEMARKAFIEKLKAYDQPAHKLLDDTTHRLENAFPLPLSIEPYPYPYPTPIKAQD